MFLQYINMAGATHDEGVVTEEGALALSNISTWQVHPTAKMWFQRKKPSVTTVQHGRCSPW